VTGDLDHGPLRRDLARQTAPHHLSTSDIAASYEPQIDALTRPPRTNASPD
jgi:hypothetical protein